MNSNAGCDPGPQPFWQWAGAQFPGLLFGLEQDSGPVKKVAPGPLSETEQPDPSKCEQRWVPEPRS